MTPISPALLEVAGFWRAALGAGLVQGRREAVVLRACAALVGQAAPGVAAVKVLEGAAGRAAAAVAIWTRGARAGLWRVHRRFGRAAGRGRGLLRRPCAVTACSREPRSFLVCSVFFFNIRTFVWSFTYLYLLLVSLTIELPTTLSFTKFQF